MNKNVLLIFFLLFFALFFALVKKLPKKLNRKRKFWTATQKHKILIKKKRLL